MDIRIAERGNHAALAERRPRFVFVELGSV
jgi:hypothetical protein